MSAKVHYVRIGFFVVLAVSLIIGGVVVFGAAHIFESPVLVETYFDQSVQGLEVGSDVKHRGVKIGRVKEIGFVHEHYKVDENDRKQRKASRYVRIVVAITSTRKDQTFETVRKLITYGLRICIRAQGITGTMLLETDFADANRMAEDLPIFWEPEYFYIPSMPNTMTELTTSLQGVFDRLNKLEIEKGVEQFNSTLQAIEVAVKDAKIGELSAQIKTLAENATASSERLNKILESEEIHNGLRGVNEAINNVIALTGNLTNEVPRLFDKMELLGRTIGRSVSEQNDNLDQTLQNVDKLVIGATDLVNEIKANPSLLIFSKPAATFDE